MHSMKMTITPALARVWLTKNTNNRPLRLDTVKRYVRDIMAGNWLMTGESIIFSTADVLLDGQHRLEAVSRADMPIEALVVFGVTPDAYKAMGQCRPRGASQILTMAGHSNASTLASAARWINFLTTGRSYGDAVTSAEIEIAIVNHPLISHFVSRHVGSKTLKRMPAACLAVMVLAAEKYGLSKIDEFLDKFASGTGLSKGDPAYELRERLVQVNSVTRFSTAGVVALTIKAVRAYVMGKTVGLLRYGATEDMPAI